MDAYGPPQGSMIGWGSFEEGGRHDENVEQGPLYCFNVSPNRFHNHGAGQLEFLVGFPNVYVRAGIGKLCPTVSLRKA